ncbi:hypothetical protein B0A55_04738 [Friedmanniomyces simplex]|uniref:Uncharacterized protein n=1 Tax=Friedmanniomyces simplex TaxID=329884 RepID=A0A4U0XTF2_9PEZI|nr:hypothetical protein B0A55_04738 [Friedmanniomyces simplex]
MTLKDFFHLSEEEFAERITTLTDEELMKDDIHNCRATHSGAYGAAIGAIEAPVTAGVSLVGSAIGLRRRNVAKRRLEMIHHEIEKRGLPVHKQTKRDYLIPLGIAGVSAGISGGVMDGLLHAIPADSIVDAGLDLGATAGAQVAQEAAGKLTVETGSEQIMDRGLPGTGRRNVWREKLAMSRSASSLSSMLAPPNGGVPKLALSAPPSPLLDIRPPLPPRPLSGVVQSAASIPSIRLS